MPRQWTRYRYRKDGRIKEAVTTTESEWDDWQRGWMLALEVWRLNHCSGCGQPLAESTDRENEDAYHAAPIRCWSCVEIAHASQEFREDPTASAIRYKVERHRRG